MGTDEEENYEKRGNGLVKESDDREKRRAVKRSGEEREGIEGMRIGA